MDGMGGLSGIGGLGGLGELNLLGGLGVWGVLGFLGVAGDLGAEMQKAGAAVYAYFFTAVLFFLVCMHFRVFYHLVAHFCMFSRIFCANFTC